MLVHGVNCLANIKEEEEEDDELCKFRFTLYQVFQFQKACIPIKKIVQSIQFTYSFTEN